MSIRTIMQTGQGFGSTPVSVVVGIDGQQVFAGTVPTLDEAPVIPLEQSPEIFRWTLPVEFSGQKNLSIDVTGGDLVLHFTVGDFYPMPGPSTSGPEAFGGTLWSQIIDGFTVPDPYTEVTIAGIAQSRTATEETDGQWHWLVLDGENFSATVNITAGQDYPQWSLANAYPMGGCVINGGLVYKALQAAPVNTAITDPAYWQPQS